MKRPSIVEKRCERCELVFTISNIRESRARNLLIRYTPCPHCLYVPDVAHPRYNKTGRCRGCSIPFALIQHHAQGKCNRCFMKEKRHETNGA